MSKDILIRRYIESDAPHLAAIYYNTIHTICAKDYSAEQLEAWAPLSSLDAKGWIEKWNRINPFVAVFKGQVVGFAELEENGHIDCFYCHQDYQRCGVGSTLMQAVFDEAKKHDLAKLYAEVSMTAQPFFESKGFIVTRKRTFERSGVVLSNFAMEKLLP